MYHHTLDSGEASSITIDFSVRIAEPPKKTPKWQGLERFRAGEHMEVPGGRGAREGMDAPRPSAPARASLPLGSS